MTFLHLCSFEKLEIDYANMCSTRCICVYICFWVLPT